MQVQDTKSIVDSKVLQSIWSSSFVSFHRYSVHILLSSLASVIVPGCISDGPRRCYFLHKTPLLLDRNLVRANSQTYHRTRVPQTFTFA
jgi:hypothetical protein